MRQHNKAIILRRPDAVLFDTDNTLYDYSYANKTGEQAVRKKARNLLGIEEEKFWKLYLQAREEIKLQLGATASSHSRLLYYQRVIELLGLRAHLLIALDLEQTFWRTFLANAPLFSDVKSTLNLLRSYKVPIAIVTDLTAHIQLRKLTYFGLEDIFDAVVTSEEVGIDKPDIRNFQLVMKKLKVCTTKNIWMIGDNPYTDIYGAKEFGAVTFQKLHKGVTLGKEKELPDYSFRNFSEVYKLILNVFKE